MILFVITKNYGWEHQTFCDVEGVPTFGYITEDCFIKHYPNIKYKCYPLKISIVLDYFQRFVEKTPNLNWLHGTIKSKGLIIT